MVEGSKTGDANWEDDSKVPVLRRDSPVSNRWYDFGLLLVGVVALVLADLIKTAGLAVLRWIISDGDEMKIKLLEKNAICPVKDKTVKSGMTSSRSRTSSWHQEKESWCHWASPWSSRRACMAG